MFVKEWIELRPQFKRLYCPDTFVPMARRLSDGKDYRLGCSIVMDSQTIVVDSFNSDEIHVGVSYFTSSYVGVGMIEINKLP